MKLFKRWRRSRPTDEEQKPAEAAPQEAATASSPPQASPRGKPRARRPSTMGRTLAEQAYLAEAATRLKNNPPQQ